jgi:hypothetical protein
MEFLAGNRIRGTSAEEKTQAVSGDAVWGDSNNKSIESFLQSDYTDQTSMHGDWVRSDTGSTLVAGDYTNEVLDADNNNASGTLDKTVSYDLGLLNDNKWICRYKLKTTSFSARTDTNSQHTNIMLSSTAGTGASDHMGLVLFTHSGVGNFFAVQALNNTNPTFDSPYMSHGVAVEEIWVEMIRNGDDCTVNLYSDSTYSIGSRTETKTETGANITDLRYFKVEVRKTSSGSAGTIVIEIDDIQIWNGVTESTTAIDVVDGSIFYETDTNKEYVLYNNTWTEL